MGVMSAARARLGLRLSSEKTICSLVSQLIRRSSSCTSTLPELKNTDDLYLCFARNRGNSNCVLEKWGHIVRAVKLNTSDDDKVDEIHGLTEPSSKKDIPYYVVKTVCTRFRSQILFQNYSASQISCVDPTTRPTKFQVSSSTPEKFQIPSLSNRTYGVLDWGEIDQKLYCIRDGDTKREFHVLESDNQNNVFNWRSLIPPPEGCSFIDPEEFLFLNRSKKILYWRHGICGVYVYDVTEPEKGWIESNQPSLRDAIPFLIRSQRIFVIDDLHHSVLGNFNLVFNLVVTDLFDYDCCVVYPFFLSENCDTFEAINNPIHLPPEMTIVGLSGAEFVNLGDKKFCIVVHDPWESTIVLKYEYDVIVSSDNVVEIHTRLLGTRTFRFKNYNNNGLDYIVGAFML